MTGYTTPRNLGPPLERRSKGSRVSADDRRGGEAWRDRASRAWARLERSYQVYVHRRFEASASADRLPVAFSLDEKRDAAALVPQGGCERRLVASQPHKLHLRPRRNMRFKLVHAGPYGMDPTERTATLRRRKPWRMRRPKKALQAYDQTNPIQRPR